MTGEPDRARKADGQRLFLGEPPNGHGFSVRLLHRPAIFGCDRRRSRHLSAGRLACMRQRVVLPAPHSPSHQSINSNPLIISIATAVPPCTPNATVLLPP